MRKIHVTISNTKPKLQKLGGANFTYLINAVIQAGQPLPWGINWAITYPKQIVWQVTRP